MAELRDTRNQPLTAPLTEEERDAEVLALRDVWLSRLMFNSFVGWEPETRSFAEFLEAHGVS